MAASLGFFFYLSLLSLILLSPYTTAAAGVGIIQRTTAQQILATLEPNSYQTPMHPILSSPSGDYSVYFLRRATIPGAGGFGGDFCYVQVRETKTGQSVWESECTPMSTANTCSLVFSDQGLEIFDGSRSAWDTGVDVSVHLEFLEMVDEGDMRIRDQNGDLVWRASDDPRSNQVRKFVGVRRRSRQCKYVIVYIFLHTRTHYTRTFFEPGMWVARISGNAKCSSTIRRSSGYR